MQFVRDIAVLAAFLVLGISVNILVFVVPKVLS